jgi:hypothetical protein
MIKSVVEICDCISAFICGADDELFNGKYI